MLGSIPRCLSQLSEDTSFEFKSVLVIKEKTWEPWSLCITSLHLPLVPDILKNTPLLIFDPFCSGFGYIMCIHIPPWSLEEKYEH